MAAPKFIVSAGKKYKKRGAPTDKKDAMGTMKIFKTLGYEQKLYRDPGTDKYCIYDKVN